MSDDLKPCPWCGAAPLVETVGQYTGKWFCVDADCPASDMKPVSYEQWNTRAEPAPMTPPERAFFEAAVYMCEDAWIPGVCEPTIPTSKWYRLWAAYKALPEYLARPKAAQGEER